MNTSLGEGAVLSVWHLLPTAVVLTVSPCHNALHSSKPLLQMQSKTFLRLNLRLEASV